MKLKSAIGVLILILVASSPLNAQTIGLKGMAAGWTTLSYSDQCAGQLGGRYIPQVDILLPLKNKLTIEGEFSANMIGSYTSPTTGDNFYGIIKPYRMWLKLSGNQFEIRAGLQKINFGSASMLRPLMWFDSIDPRDPLQLTDGVYGVLGRYYTLNNINFWGWGLWGNKNPKGWEILSTEENKIEFGGRFQFPVSRAEIGLSYHNRRAVLPLETSGYSTDMVFPENRIGLDIKADLGVGLWVEEVIKHQKNGVFPYTNMLTLGVDYTFGLGSGINVKAEHFIYQSSDEFLGGDQSVKFTGISAGYPISIVTNINAIIYYDWMNKEYYRFLNLGLSYDRFSYYLMGFWNPERFRIFEIESGPSLFNGAGIQLMVVFNH